MRLKGIRHLLAFTKNDNIQTLMSENENNFKTRLILKTTTTCQYQCSKLLTPKKQQEVSQQKKKKKTTTTRSGRQFLRIYRKRETVKETVGRKENRRQS